MSTPDNSYPPGQQGSSGNGGYQQGGGYPPPTYDQGQYQAGGQPQTGQPQYGQPQAGQPQTGQGQYEQGQYGQGQYGQQQYGQPQYGQGQPGQYGQQQYGQAQPGYEQTQFQQAPSYASYPQAGGYQQAGPYGAMPQGPYMQSGQAGAAGYLLGGGVGFGEAVRLAWQNKFVYEGRASRSAYWWFYLAMVIVGFAFAIVVAILAAATHSAALIGILYAIVAIGALIVGLPLAVRRLHDTDRSGWWLLFGLVPFVGGIVLFVFSVLEGTRGPNRFGG